MQKYLWFAYGLLIGLTALSITRAAVPTKNRITDDTAIYQKLSEINVKKEILNFDSEINELALKEKDFREKLPSPQARMKGAMSRVAQEKYRFSGKSSSLSNGNSSSVRR